VRWQSLDPNPDLDPNLDLDPNPDLDPHRGKLQDPGQAPNGDQYKSKALVKDYLSCKKDDASGERKCLKEGGRADLKGEREAVVAEVSLTGQQVQPEESIGKKTVNYSIDT
jgi:hypothetical protein